jgi:hypothetical protein
MRDILGCEKVSLDKHSQSVVGLLCGILVFTGVVKWQCVFGLDLTKAGQMHWAVVFLNWIATAHLKLLTC